MGVPPRRRYAAGYLPIFTVEFRGSTAMLSLPARAAYAWLLCAYWDERAPLPDDDKRLALLSGAGKHWAHIRREVEPLFQISGGLWRSAYVDHELAYFRFKSQTQSARAAARWARVRAARAKSE